MSEHVYLPMDCPVCGRRRVEWNGSVLRCEKCTTSSEWDGFSRVRYKASGPLLQLARAVQDWSKIRHRGAADDEPLYQALAALNLKDET